MLSNPVSVSGQGPAPAANVPTMRSAEPASSTILHPSANGVANSSANEATLAGSHAADDDRHIWLVTGPAGCGKSTIAKFLADKLNLPMIEGDDWHPPENIAKMSRREALTDADRWDWLTRLREESVKQLSSGKAGVVLTCSALKRKYRDVIRVAPYFFPHLHLHFIYLDASEELLEARVKARQGHFFTGGGLVHSQFEALEPPTPDETDVLSIDVSRTPDEVKADALARVMRTMDHVRQNGN